MPVNLSKKQALPKGFKLSVASAAIKGGHAPQAIKLKNDLLLIHSDAGAVSAGVFTTNKVKGAPVLVSMPRVRSGRASAVVVNSGNANVCTGKRGIKDAEEMTAIAAKGLGIPEKQVLVSSTGVIGVPMPMTRVRQGMKKLMASTGSAKLLDAARAIMTTDSFPKHLTTTIKVGGKEARITAMCKGAGMIEPDMATMLCFCVTDLAVERRALNAALKEAVRDTFNMLTVDGDQSTSDMVIVLANGLAGNRPVAPGSRGQKLLSATLREMFLELASMIARDGEGATRLVHVYVNGAATEAKARKAAKAIANSLLVKTAIHGADPNWGRILPVLGRGGVAKDPSKSEIYIGRIKVASKGGPTKQAASASKELKKKEVSIRVELGEGRASARAITCDLTAEYIRINSEYTT